MRSILRCAAFCFMACASFAQASNEDVRIADEGKIGAWWQLADGVRIGAPGYPEQALAGRHDACIALGYLIQPDGTTSDHVVVGPLLLVVTQVAVRECCSVVSETQLGLAFTNAAPTFTLLE